MVKEACLRGNIGLFALQYRVVYSTKGHIATHNTEPFITIFLSQTEIITCLS